MSNQKVIIVGAGLSGSLLAIYLAKKGIAVEVYEARGDMRKEAAAAGRSINLALSARGIAALKEVGLDEYMLAEAVPMYGRMIHTIESETKLLPYSGRTGEYINSVSRAGLNVALIDEAEKYEGVKFHFNQKCVRFDATSGEAHFESGASAKGDTLIATDGAGSAVRDAMLRGGVPRFDFSQKWLAHGYKELHIPPLEIPDSKFQIPNSGNQQSESNAPADETNPESGIWNLESDSNLESNFRMQKNALHIWARGAFMMIALPNFDGSFTCTLFLAHEGENSFASVLGGEDQRPKTEDQIKNSILSFFQKNFPDAVPLMPTLTEDFLANPIGNLGTIQCYPWNVGGKALLLGDSAHAVVPFYGQGMNASFEDCRILNELIDRYDADWEKIFDEFTRIRKPNTDAIAAMAEENFYEMRDSVADPVFQRKRTLETKLEQTFPDYFSKYSMVTFRADLPYETAREKGNAQDKLLMEICAKTEDVQSLNLDSVMGRINSLEENKEEYILPEPAEFMFANFYRDGGSFDLIFRDAEKNEYVLDLKVILDRKRDYKRVGYKAPVLRIYSFKDKGETTAAEQLTWEQGIELGEKLKIIVDRDYGYYSESEAERVFEILRRKGDVPEN